MREIYPASAGIFVSMAEEENDHRRRLLDLYLQRFGDHIPLIRREDVRGFIRRKPVWMTSTFDVDAMRDRAKSMEDEAAYFYRRAAARSSDPAVRALLGDLADIESGHAELADQLKAGVSKGDREEERET